MPAKTATKNPAPPAAPSDADRVSRVEEVADLTGLSVSAVYKMFADGRIRTIKLGTRRVVPADEMRRILTEGI
jgi:excisionase family DNA binding protein